MSVVRSLLVTLCAVVILASGSVVSSALMAPDRGDAAMEQIGLIGMDAGDICGDVAHDHRCPFCHMVAAPSLPGPADIESRLLPHSAWRRATDLHRAAQARDHARSPRAPPSIG
ncbi:hypothetical protein GCM10011360_27190 [Primorskyibacter flagellatus]|uniref:DUF2946 domain-containing protein n=1 Tax=Primorskyibacter flagellatus TaxID=1387277 RepID=A0A917EI79_9RHOB|nr:hypothetical protein [Primorskyibacter flagellatus]GGE37940.1 hypothetical protein GCM10011360_27190 [Primorskyibacter flagellatus]